MWQTERNDALEERIALVETHAREARDRLRVLEVDAKSLKAQTAILEAAAALGRVSAAREVTETAAKESRKPVSMEFILAFEDKGLLDPREAALVRELRNRGLVEQALIESLGDQ